MHAIVTGAAGFIGSHLSERLIKHGWNVTGIDCFTEYYDRATKERNLERCQNHQNFTFREADLVGFDWNLVMPGASVVFHLAAQAGVRASWGPSFDDYLHHNLLATQHLLESIRQLTFKPQVIYASSSSVYGDAESLPTSETTALLPVSPYGITKQAAERLGFVYWQYFGVPFTALRYFSVYGPRQRPDMAFHRFIRAMRQGKPIEIYGDGRQTRDFTYIDDVVVATLAAASTKAAVGEAINIGGGSRVSLCDALATLEAVSGHICRRLLIPAQPGDARHTGADTIKAEKLLGYRPQTTLREGLAAMWIWSENLDGLI